MNYSKILGRTTHDLPKGKLERVPAYLIQGGAIHSSEDGTFILLPLGKRAWEKFDNVVRSFLKENNIQEIKFPIPWNPKLLLKMIKNKSTKNTCLVSLSIL